MSITAHKRYQWKMEKNTRTKKTQVEMMILAKRINKNNLKMNQFNNDKCNQNKAKCYKENNLNSKKFRIKDQLIKVRINKNQLWKYPKRIVKLAIKKTELMLKKMSTMKNMTKNMPMKKIMNQLKRLKIRSQCLPMHKENLNEKLLTQF